MHYSGYSDKRGKGGLKDPLRRRREDLANAQTDHATFSRELCRYYEVNDCTCALLSVAAGIIKKDSLRKRLEHSGQEVDPPQTRK